VRILISGIHSAKPRLHMAIEMRWPWTPWPDLPRFAKDDHSSALSRLIAHRNRFFGRLVSAGTVRLLALYLWPRPSAR